MHLAFSRPQRLAAAATDAGVACTGSSGDGDADRRAPNAPSTAVPGASVCRAAPPGVRNCVAQGQSRQQAALNATQADLATRQAQDA